MPRVTSIKGCYKAGAVGRRFTKIHYASSPTMEKDHVTAQDAISKEEMTGTAVPQQPSTREPTTPKKRNACSIFLTWSIQGH